MIFNQSSYLLSSPGAMCSIPLLPLIQFPSSLICKCNQPHLASSSSLPAFYHVSIRLLSQRRGADSVRFNMLDIQNRTTSGFITLNWNNSLTGRVRVQFADGKYVSSAHSRAPLASLLENKLASVNAGTQSGSEAQCCLVFTTEGGGAAFCRRTSAAPGYLSSVPVFRAGCGL